jgi:hypothetical protein
MTFEQVKVTDPYTYAQEYLADKVGISVGQVLDSGNVLFRDIATGRFAFANDFWTEFRENYTGGP